MAQPSVLRSGQFGESGLLEIPSRSSVVCSNVVDLSCNVKIQGEKGGWRKFLSHLGPGFLVSIAYMDPGNLESDFHAGAQYKYELLWVILVASIFALIIQSLAANLGVITGKHLAEHCSEEYPSKISFILWLLAEVAVIAANIPEVLGTAFALNMLFYIPVWAGVLMTGLSTIMTLGLQRYGIRKLEAFIGLLVSAIFVCFLGELAYAKPKPKEVIKGVFVPQLNGNGATGLAISLLGAMVMPHNLFLHSALVLSRKVTHAASDINSTCRYFLIETGVALFIAFIINVAVITVSGSVCSSPNISPQDLKSCGDLDLNKASFLLNHVLGDWSSKVFAVALLASGQSSTITGTYAGQYVMQGFLNFKIKTWLRNLITQCIAIIPCLVVSVIYGSSGAGKLIIVSSMILSFDLPFALIPLLKFTSCKTKMGPHRSSTAVSYNYPCGEKLCGRLLLFNFYKRRLFFMLWQIVVVGSLIGCGTIGINMYYLSKGFGTWLVHNNLPKVASVFIGLLIFPLTALYVVAVLYLAFRRDRKDTYIAPRESSVESPSNTEGL